MNAEASFRRFHAELFAYLRGRVATEADAQDLLQTIFLKLLRSDAVHRVRDLRAYLYRIARTSLSEYYREGSQAKRETESWLRHADDATRNDRDPLAGNLEACLRAFAENLSPAYREAVIAVDFEAEPQKDLARRLGRPYSSVKSRVQEGRRRLRQEFLECCRLETDGAGPPRPLPRDEAACETDCSPD
ncbi:MAG: sigma-70 family RNA polymerase sigma factor [bacterium]|nr:sigma-70 family RNA polymerase sigma factor [bacterium]